MYLTSLHISRLKLLRELRLDFTTGGAPRMWTVIIGENGTCKTSVLKAIALAAAGVQNVEELVQEPEQYCDRRATDPLTVEAEFFIDPESRELRQYPGYAWNATPDCGMRVKSTFAIDPQQDYSISGGSAYLDMGLQDPKLDPISEARSDERRLWFVAAYGVERAFWKRPEKTPNLHRPSIDRLRPLFGSRDLFGSAVESLFSSAKAKLFESALANTLFGGKKLLPGLSQTPSERTGLHGRDQFVQRFGDVAISLPISWLSHGYQSTFSWIADLVGNIVLEADAEDLPTPQAMEGLVLIDEIDLYLHPAWQRHLIRGLRDTFPRIQFVATTHSPLSLVGLRTDLDEIVVLRPDAKTGNIEVADLRRGREHEPDPRLMTASEILRDYFDVEEVYPSDVGEKMRRFRYIAADPTRSDADELELNIISDELKASGIEVRFPRATRESK